MGESQGEKYKHSTLQKKRISRLPNRGIALKWIRLKQNRTTNQDQDYRVVRGMV